MTDPKQAFTHISVNDGSDDDIVIQAGASRAADGHASAGSSQEAMAEDSLSEDTFVEDGLDYSEESEVTTESEDDEVVYSDDEYDFEDDDDFDVEDDVEQEEVATSAVSSSRDDGYRQTTLEDLQSTPMSTTQKVVIGVVLAVLAVAVVYFTFFMK